MIFEDPTRLRWKTTLNVFITLGIIGILLISGFALSLAINPPVPPLPVLSKNRKAFDHLIKRDETGKNSDKITESPYLGLGVCRSIFDSHF